MEKLFWGMVGGCTVAFAILLGMYLNKTGVIGAEPESSRQRLRPGLRGRCWQTASSPLRSSP